jgi:hypothetical protein
MQAAIRQGQMRTRTLLIDSTSSSSHRNKPELTPTSRGLHANDLAYFTPPAFAAAHAHHELERIRKPLGGHRAPQTEFGENARRMLDIDDPALDWCTLARGMGVEAARAESAEQFDRLFAASIGRKGPFLIEAII